MTPSHDHRSIQPYLFFAGRAEEAIAFYGHALGAELVVLMRYQDSPEPPSPGTLPPGWEQKVMHATLRVGPAILMLSDGCEAGNPGFRGFSLSLQLNDRAQAERAFAALSDGGKISMPLTPTFWSPCFGMVEDRFGVAWMVTVPSPPPSQP